MSGQTARVVNRVIEPNVSLQVKYEHTNRMKEVTVNRLRLGKCLVHHYDK